MARHTLKLTTKDTVIVSEFTNTTGDQVFDGALRQGLAVQLEQSPYLNIVSRSADRADAEIYGAGERCAAQRRSCAASLRTDEQRGDPGRLYLANRHQFNLILKAVNCVTGDTIVSTEAQASDKDHVLSCAERSGGEHATEIGRVAGIDTEIQRASGASDDSVSGRVEGVQFGPRRP